MAWAWAWFLLYLHLFLFHFPSFSSSFNFSCHHDESSALLQFKSSFTLLSSATSGSCVGHEPSTATWKNGTDCCSWNGVTCDIVSGHVIGLNLACEGLEGKLHHNSTLFHLVHLQTLNLSYNHFVDDFFVGSHFDSKFGGFKSLTHLDLSYSFFGGEIPTQISHLSKLQSLHLSGYYQCNLDWKETTLKRFLQNATGLRELFLDYTNMSSIRPNSIPLLFNQSSSLVTLNLAWTGLSGNLKNNFLCLPSIQELYMSKNFNLEGQLPELSCSTSLRILDLSWCHFQGKIPISFSNLTHLTSLTLSDNNLNGSIPNVFGGMTKLQELHLHFNNLEGQIPSSLFNLTQLVTLDCSYNKLEGPLPSKITGFQKLTDLRLNDNLLNGTIPSSLLSLPSLVDLDLSNNRLTGPISEISSYSLESLFLNNNRLQGNIPESIFNLPNLTFLILSANNFSGAVDFQHFSKLQNLETLSLSYNSQLSLTFESNVHYNFSQLQELGLSSLSLSQFPELSVSFLNSIDLSNNKLNGRVPNWLLENSGSLNLSQNMFTSIDQISSNSQRLYSLDLSFNLLVGDLSESICNMSSLDLLNLAHNQLTGIIPQCLANLSSLQVLDLQMNRFYGTLPSNFSEDQLEGQIPKSLSRCMLRTLNLHGNQLEGQIPKSLSRCTYLEFLNLGGNNIEDSFPVWLQTLQYLQVLVLQDNKLHGIIPNPKIKDPFPSLIIFDISGNNFSGQLPKAFLKKFEAMKKVTELGYLMNGIQEPIPSINHVSYTSLLRIRRYYDSVIVSTKGNKMTLVKIPNIFIVIDLSRNKFEGVILNAIGDLHGLKGLNFSHNRLTGHIPKSIANLTYLESLDLSSNMLTGVIPAELTNLGFLEVLDLSNNHLVGEIPQGKQFNTFTNDSYEGNLGLCGFPLSKICGPDHHSPPSPNNSFWSEEKFGFGWKPVAIGYGCGFVIGIGIGYYMFLIGKPRWLVMIFGGQPKRRVIRRTRVRRNHSTTMNQNQMVQMS